jgi:hypothetical protein
VKAKFKGCTPPTRQQLLDAGFDPKRPIQSSIQRWNDEKHCTWVFTQDEKPKFDYDYRRAVRKVYPKADAYDYGGRDGWLVLVPSEDDDKPSEAIGQGNTAALAWLDAFNQLPKEKKS